VITLKHGDCRDVLRTLPDKSVHCCVTSPPYFGLRDYGVAGQIGLEATPDAFVAEMVAVFAEVRRVLRDDGTLWLNLGDSYSGHNLPGWRPGNEAKNNGSSNKNGVGYIAGLKPKDLIGIPWRVAFALQQPYYTGKIKDERDRVWLAAMLDGEGCITISEYETGDRTKSNIYIGITNSSVSIIEKCGRLFPQINENVYQKSGIINRTVFRWDVERIEQKSLFIREIYPHLVAKQKQAILGYTFIEMQRGLASKKKGYLPEQQEKRTWLANAMSTLNRGGDVDLPDWAVEPPSLYEPGFYLRQDIIWSKPNPMPESVTDRCTKAHEYIFLLSKSARYFYDAAAIKEPSARPGDVQTFGGNKGRAYEPALNDPNFRNGHEQWGRTVTTPDNRNKRSVWEVTTQPFSEAHFATFPPALIEPCILAGCPKGGAVLDPFGGAGTTGLVADRLGRNALLIELNPEYAAMAEQRIRNDAGMFAEVQV
jgi:DNA modification methylase